MKVAQNTIFTDSQLNQRIILRSIISLNLEWVAVPACCGLALKYHSPRTWLGFLNA